VWPKWPNDVYIGAKKAGGILSESLISGGRVDRLVIGIGLNVNAAGFPAALKDKATSLFLETGKNYPRGRIIAMILREFDECRAHAPERLISEWTALTRTINSYVSVLSGSGERFYGRAMALNEDGSLVIGLEGGKTVSVGSGEVTTNAPCR
jgi:BirA family biotin operon repressor/biotin-[acetyl-CoA-carboxylase] ligase